MLRSTIALDNGGTSAKLVTSHRATSTLEFARLRTNPLVASRLVQKSATIDLAQTTVETVGLVLALPALTVVPLIHLHGFCRVEDHLISCRGCRVSASTVTARCGDGGLRPLLGRFALCGFHAERFVHVANCLGSLLTKRLCKKTLPDAVSDRVARAVLRSGTVTWACKRLGCLPCHKTCGVPEKPSVSGEARGRVGPPHRAGFREHGSLGRARAHSSPPGARRQRPSASRATGRCRPEAFGRHDAGRARGRTASG